MLRPLAAPLCPDSRGGGRGRGDPLLGGEEGGWKNDPVNHLRPEALWDSKPWVDFAKCEGGGRSVGISIGPAVGPAVGIVRSIGGRLTKNTSDIISERSADQGGHLWPHLPSECYEGVPDVFSVCRPRAAPNSRRQARQLARHFFRHFFSTLFPFFFAR